MVFSIYALLAEVNFVFVKNKEEYFHGKSNKYPYPPRRFHVGFSRIKTLISNVYYGIPEFLLHCNCVKKTTTGNRSKNPLLVGVDGCDRLRGWRAAIRLCCSFL